VNREQARTELAAERDATIALFEAAQAKLGRVEPAGLREPLWWFFAAKLEQTRAHASILGLPLNYAIDMAKAILSEEAS
jgi:hypothetical protein